MFDEMQRNQIEYEVANEFAINLLFVIAQKYHISEAKVIDIFDALNYWNVLNNDRVCCAVAHDGVKAVVQRLEGEINGILIKKIDKVVGT